MKTNRIILLHSINDKTTRNKVSLQENSPRLTVFHIKHCYIVDVNVPDHESESLRSVLDSYELTYEDLFKRLDEMMKSFKPEMILVHIGIGFRKNPELVIKVLTEIKKRYPQLQIGSDRQISAEVFDETEEIIGLRELFFLRPQALIDERHKYGL